MWQRKLSPKDMAKVVEILLTNGKTLEQEEFPAGEYLHQDLCEELATLITAFCGGKLVEVDADGNILIQGNAVAPNIDSSIWRFAGDNTDSASAERHPLKNWVPYPNHRDDTESLAAGTPVRLSELVAKLSRDLDENGDTEIVSLGIAVSGTDGNKYRLDAVIEGGNIEVIRDCNFVNGMACVVADYKGTKKVSV